MKNKVVFITGNSSGLGKGLTQALLGKGYKVYGCSRRGCDLDGDIVDGYCDLADFDSIPDALNQLLGEAEYLDLVILNAGILGPIKYMSDTSVDELRQIMELNVWSNKIVLDWLLQSGIQIKQILLMSSGAAVLGNKGWGGYALSKAALNMLGRLYAHEFPDTHIASIAPGLIETKMTDYLCDEADKQQFPALRRIQQARGTSTMLSPAAAAERILQSLEPLRDYESGSFVDIRQILAPEEYEELMRNWNKANK